MDLSNPATIAGLVTLIGAVAAAVVSIIGAFKSQSNGAKLDQIAATQQTHTTILAQQQPPNPPAAA